MPPKKSKIPEVLRKNEDELVNAWVKAQLALGSARPDLIREDELRAQSAQFVRSLRDILQSGNLQDLRGGEWNPIRDLLADLSGRRAMLGFSPAETAMFVMSFKQPLFEALTGATSDAATLADELWTATLLIDELAIVTFESYLKVREELIVRQQSEMLELSTPVVKLWDGILALPMIGTLDSARTQVVMESLLQKIVDTGSRIAILDITGVPTVDTLVAQHLLKTVAAARLMGAECIISGIRPQIAQTMVHLAIDLNDIVTKATLADAFIVALQKLGATPTAPAGRPRERAPAAGDKVRG